MELVKLGKVVRLHGIVGEMKISTKMDDDFDLSKLDFLYDEHGNGFQVKRKFKHDGGLIVGLHGVDINRAREFISKDFYISRELLEGKTLIEDVKGSTAWVNGKAIGKITDVQDFGSAEIFYIKLESGKELLVPNVKGIIDSFSLKDKTIVFNEQKFKEVSDYEN